MARPIGTILLPLLLLLLNDNSVVQLQAQSSTPTIALSRVLRIPLTALGAGGPTHAGPANLTVSKGAKDEPPEGPDGFDVFDDGSLLITDPLRKRLALFDSSSKFR